MRLLMTYAILLLAGFVLSMTLGGCGCGNGEGYAGRIGCGSRSTPDTSNTTPGGNVGRYYFWKDPTYTCTQPSTGQVIASYRNALYVESTSARLLGDACGNGASATDVYADVTFWLNRAYALHGQGIYERSGSSTVAGTSTAIETEVLCRKTGPAAGETTDIVVRRFNDDSRLGLTLRTDDTGSVLGEHANLALTAATSNRRFHGIAFDLNVSTTPTLTAPLRHEGVIGLDSGTSVVQCWLP